jgi:hypothetical protein
MKDIIVSVNRKDTSTMTLPQVQHIIDNSVKNGHLDLRIKRESGEGMYQPYAIVSKTDIWIS